MNIIYIHSDPIKIHKCSLVSKWVGWVQVWIFNNPTGPSLRIGVISMCKTLQTKKAILKMLSDKPKTMTDISRELGLAPSTISQHITELKWVGAIEQVDNFHVKKWKYYKLSQSFSAKPIKEVIHTIANEITPMKVMVVNPNYR
jgi:DNA-binding transcriptional ArsR family regulator